MPRYFRAIIKARTLPILELQADEEEESKPILFFSTVRQEPSPSEGEKRRLQQRRRSLKAIKRLTSSPCRETASLSHPKNEMKQAKYCQVFDDKDDTGSVGSNQEDGRQAKIIFRSDEEHTPPRPTQACKQLFSPNGELSTVLEEDDESTQITQEGRGKVKTASDASSPDTRSTEASDSSHTPQSPPVPKRSLLDLYAISSPSFGGSEEDDDLNQSNIPIGIQPISLQIPPLIPLNAGRTFPPKKASGVSLSKKEERVEASTPSKMEEKAEEGTFLSPSRQKPDPPATKIGECYFYVASPGSGTRIGMPGYTISKKGDCDCTEVSELTVDSVSVSGFVSYCPDSATTFQTEKGSSRTSPGYSSSFHTARESILSAQSRRVRKIDHDIQSVRSQARKMDVELQSIRSQGSRMRDLINKFESLSNANPSQAASKTGTDSCSLVPKLEPLTEDRFVKQASLSLSRSPSRKNASQGFFWRSHPTIPDFTSDTCPDDSDFEQSTVSDDCWD